MPTSSPWAGRRMLLRLRLLDERGTGMPGALPRQEQQARRSEDEKGDAGRDVGQAGDPGERPPAGEVAAGGELRKRQKAGDRRHGGERGGRAVPQARAAARWPIRSRRRIGQTSSTRAPSGTGFEGGRGVKAPHPSTVRPVACARR